MNICKRVIGLEGDKVCTSGPSDLFKTHTYVSICIIFIFVFVFVFVVTVAVCILQADCVDSTVFFQDS